jgi:alkanesulfonate monooxygenase SsuD/methylene tetrahydromethanopterin reductase-like flavin-dependent oxidoreductase (luciferase family)
VEEGRDPATVGRSAGVVVAPLARAGHEGLFGSAITGSPDAIADAFRTFREAGFTQLEFMFEPETREALDVMGRVLELVRAA